MVAGRRPDLAGALAMLLAMAPAAASARDWHQVATREDRARLREWRTAWMDALGDTVPRDPLLDPDHSVSGASLPPGSYRCRRIQLGAQGPRGWEQCRVELGVNDTRVLSMSGAGQRPEGVIYPDTDTRSVFLGTWRMADERHAMAYGRDRQRNLPGWVERVDAKRWRLVLPYPGFGATMELVELVPVTGSAGSIG